MDPFALIVFGGVAAMIIALLLLGKYYPGSGADQLDWRPTRTPEQEAQNEIDDLDQMLEAANERRRRRGEADLTEATMRDRIAEDTRKQTELRDSYLAGREDPDAAQEEIRQMLEVKNERRRRRGLPEITEAEFRAQVEGPAAAD